VLDLNIPPISAITMGMVFTLLVIASFSRLLLEKKNPNQDYAELRQRIQSWWVIVLLLFVVLILSNNAAITFFGLVSFLALKEFLSIVPTRQTDRRILFWAYISIPFQYYWIASGWYEVSIIFIPVYVFLFLPMRAVLIGDTQGFIRSLSIIHWAVMLTVFCISHIAILLTLPVKNEQAGAIGLVLYLIFMTQFNDVCQYLWGKSFGRHKIIPKVSPNKTWEGLLGAMITMTVISAVIAPWLTPLTWQQGLAAGALISGSGFIGDVVVSSVKRDLRIKDSGDLIPGHGGILDRMDSLIYTAPLFFHFLYYLHF